MNKKEILLSIQENCYERFDSFVSEGGDINLKIYGKSLLLHALRYKSDACLNLLLLYGADTKSLKAIPGWEDKLEDIDPEFLEMVREMDEVVKFYDAPRAQQIIQETSIRVLGDRQFSFRNVLSHSVTHHAYATTLMVGLHLYEYRSWDFLMKDMKNIFQCEDVTAKDFKPNLNKKYAMIVTASVLSEFDEEIPGLSLRIRGFLQFLEIPSTQLEYQLGKMNERESLIVGVHFSDEPSLVVKGEGEIDINDKFLASTPEPIFFSSVYTFNFMGQWDHQLNSWVKVFKDKYGHFPNILLASSATYSRIDLVANARGKDQLTGPSGEKPTEEEFASMQGFKGNGYELDFCIEESLGIDTVKLIYDSDPGGGIPIPDDEEDNVDEWMNAIAG